MEKTIDVTLWFTLGEPSEEKVLTLFQSLLPSIAVINLCQSIKLLSNEDGIDHHVWLNPKLAKIQAKLIAKSLKKYFPQNSFLYEKNLSLFLMELDELDRDITDLLAPYKGKAILVSHPAFGYFCEAYSLRQISVEAGEKDPLAKTLQALLETVKKEQISIAFIQPQHNNTAIEYIAHLLKIPTIVVDPYSSDYEKNLKTIAQLIANDGRR
jgi:zinc transport system substrate-binding protein